MAKARDPKRKTVVHKWEEVPAFASEAEEAAFWSTHELGAELLAQMTPEIGETLPPARSRTKPISLRFEEDTLTRARVLASRRGTGYQTLLKEFIFERLYEEEKREGLVEDAAQLVPQVRQQVERGAGTEKGRRSQAPSKKREGRRVREGLLAGHYRRGRTFQPPLLAHEETIVSDWIRDDLPDLLWPLVLVTLRGDEAARLIGTAQQVVLEAVPPDVLEATGAALDGRLTSMDRFPSEVRATVIDALRREGLGEAVFPQELASILALYDGAPGVWLVAESWRQTDHPMDEEDAANLLAGAIVTAAIDDSVNSLVKTPPFGWLLLRGKLRLPPEVTETLKNYPIDRETWPVAEATIRSSFLALKAADAHHHPEFEEEWRRWAASFWSQNWVMSQCVVGEAVAPSEVDEEAEGLSEARDQAERALAEAGELYEGFLRLALSRSLRVDLHHPERHEVTAGLVARAYRAVTAALETPSRWSGEHGFDIMRLLVETQFVLRWMSLQPDDSAFANFQSYGEGKQKLMRLAVDDLVARFSEEVPEELRRLVDTLQKKTGGEWGEQFQEVSLEATFAGRTMRRIAEEAGMLETYQHVYQPASAVAHGEWWVIEDYAMQRCRNPLHLLHRLPSLRLTPVEPRFPTLLVGHLERLVEIALEALGINTTDSDESIDSEAEGRRDD